MKAICFINNGENYSLSLIKEFEPDALFINQYYKRLNVDQMKKRILKVGLAIIVIGLSVNLIGHFIHGNQAVFIANPIQ